MSFIERQIVITITLQPRQGLPEMGIAANANPKFQGTNSNTVTIQGGGLASQNGLRIAAHVTRSGAPGFAEANVQIYNLPISLINQIGTLGVPFLYTVGKNQITIAAGNAGSTPTTIFQGTINQAWGDFSGMPDSIFNISAQAITFAGSQPVTATTYDGSVATILTNLAQQAQLKLINNFTGGATPPPLKGQYVSGSVRDAIRGVCSDANINYYIDDVNGALLIGPKNGSLSAAGAQTPEISPPPYGTMVGYPSYTSQGLKCRIEFSTDITYGTTVTVSKSELQQANGPWVIYYMDYDLECQAPDGPWFTNLEMGLPGFTIASQPGSQ